MEAKAAGYGPLTVTLRVHQDGIEEGAKLFAEKQMPGWKALGATLVKSTGVVEVVLERQGDV